ncbi:MAG: NADH-quinone oxidoreductase subunit M [Magnetococcales bacterium]|nr:NADH-quinone oxidoreductase subunit M [Magnetococcales bacterium]
MLKALILTPILGALLIVMTPSRRVDVIRGIAFLVTGVVLAEALWLVSLFDATQSGIQFYETSPWRFRLATAFALGVDGFSMPLVVLTALLTFVATLASSRVRGMNARFYYALLAILEAAIMGVFCAQDWSLFYIFWEMTLIPLFFLIDRLGGANRQRAALNFVLYTMGGSVFMLISILLLYDNTGVHSFNMAVIAQSVDKLPRSTQAWIFLGLLVGLGVKVPIFPIHGWLPLAHVEAPSPVSVLLSGVMLKMGSYGLIRAVGTLPDAASTLQKLLVALAFINLLYGGVLAWRQRDLKAMVAYSSVSHMGVVLLGIAALNTTGFVAATFQMLAHGLVSGALFLLVGAVYERSHSRDIADYSALARVMPHMAFFLVLSFVAAVGLPGTAGFIAELHTLIAGFGHWGAWMALISLGMMISAAYAIRTMGTLFSGKVSERMQDIKDMTRPEWLAAGLLSLGTLGLGVLPGPVLARIGVTASYLGRLFE